MKIKVKIPRCPHCGNVIHSSHCACGVHAPNGAAYKNSHKNRPSNFYPRVKPEKQTGKNKAVRECLICGSQIREDRYSKHMKNIHGVDALTSEAELERIGRERRAEQNKRGVRECLICGSPIREDRYVKHMKNIHSVDALTSEAELERIGRERRAEQNVSQTTTPETALEAPITATATILMAPPLIFTGQPPQGSFPERLKRVQVLTKQATPSAIQELVAALADENGTIIWTAAAGLRQIGGAHVVRVLQAFMAQTESIQAITEAKKILSQLKAQPIFCAS